MENPVKISSTGVTILFSMDAMRTPEIGRTSFGSNFGAKRFWLSRLVPNQKVAWNVLSPQEGLFKPTFLVNGEVGQEIELIGPQNTVQMKLAEKGWQRATAPDALKLPKGRSVVEMKIELGTLADFKAVELVPVAEEQNIAKRIEAMKGDISWMSTAGYGIMVQGGGWSFPPHGPKKPWPGFAEDFNAGAFVERVHEMGGSYIVWSATWADYLFPAPIQAIAEVMPNRVSKRDLIADLITECRKRNMKLLLYYHLGHDQKDVMIAKGWKPTGPQDPESRQKWMDREEKIFTEIGLRYGDGIAGYFIDDGCCWYPADFEKLGRALKAGNPNRVICYNPWRCCSLTAFQDFYAGEGFTGESANMADDKGFATDPKCKGLKVWGCFCFEPGDWGVRKAETVIEPTKWTVDRVIAMTKNLEKKKFSVAINLLMYEDGSVSENSYSILKEAARKLKRGKWSER